MQYRGEFQNEQRTVDSQCPFDGTITCSCCTESLARLIRCEFRRGDTIGLTFIAQGTAFIFVGTFQALAGTVLVVSNLFVENTTSFIPLCDISSVEVGISAAQATGGPLAVAATR